MRHDKTFCASPCRNYDCDRHEVNVDSDYYGGISWAYFHTDCPEYISLDKEVDSWTSTGNP